MATRRKKINDPRKAPPGTKLIRPDTLNTTPVQIPSQAGSSSSKANPYDIPEGKRVLTPTGYLGENNKTNSSVVDQKATAPGQNAPVSSYEDIGRANIQSEYDALGEVGKELGLPDIYTSLDERFNDIIKGNQEARKLKEAQLNEQQDTLDYNTSNQRKAMQSQQENVAGQLSANREGFTSGSNASVSERLATATNTRMARLKQSRDNATAAIQQAKEDLARAQRSGNTELAAQYKATLDAATSQAQQIETDYINALTAQSEEERAVQAQKTANFTTFTGFVDKGTELGVEEIMDFADSLGIDFNSAYAYYDGSQSIRDDKSLSLQEKSIQLEQAKQNLLDQITGADTQAAKNTRAYINLVQSGADADTIAAFKQVAGITDYNDPFTQAELRSKNLQNSISQYEADNLGKPPPAGTMERIDYDLKKAELAKANYELNELYGNPGGIVTPEAVSEIFQIPGTSKWHSQSGKWECGEAYNRITNEGGAGNTYDSKMDLVTKRDNPMIGNGLVIPIGGKDSTGKLINGHIETVISVTPNQIQTVSWNRDLKGGQSIETYSIDELNQNYGENWGFTDSTLKDNYQDALSSSYGSGGEVQSIAQSIMDPSSNASLSDLTPTQKEKVLPVLNQLKQEALSSGDFYGVMAASAGGKDPAQSFIDSMTKANTVVTQVGLLSDKMLENEIVHADEGNDTVLDIAPLTGWISERNPWNTDAQEMKAILTGTVPNLARGVFGEVGVLTDHDIELYMQTLPNLRQTEDVKKAVTGLTLRVIRDSIENQIDLQAAGGRDMSGYARFYERVDSKINEIESSLGISDYGQGSDAFDSDMDLYMNAELENDVSSWWDSN